jgi:putative hydroxymethylpyrimidine transport system permease protein
MKRNILFSLILLLLFWQGLIWIFHLPAYILPSPKDILWTFIHSWKILLYNTGITLTETCLGLMMGGFSGCFVAILLVMIQPLRLFLLPLMLISQALPTFVIAPLLVLWLGFGMASKMVVVMLMTFFPIASALLDGLNKTPKHYLEMAHLMRGKKWSTLRYIYFPHALPFLASGLRIAAVFAPMGAVISEWVGASNGLGYLMINANARLDTSLVFASAMMLVIMALMLYFAIDGFFRWKICW